MPNVDRVAIVIPPGLRDADEVERVRVACQAQVDGPLFEAWGVRAKLEAYNNSDDIPDADQAYLVYVTAGVDGEHPEFAGWHNGTAQVSLGRAEQDGVPWSRVLSHEICESLVNPNGDRMSTDVGADGAPWLIEVCDPVQLHADCRFGNGVELSDFVFPSYFRQDGQLPFNWSKNNRLTAPFAVNDADGLAPNASGFSLPLDHKALGWRRSHHSRWFRLRNRALYPALGAAHVFKYDIHGSDALKYLRARLRDVPDFPEPGLLFKDTAPLLADPQAFHMALDLFASRFIRQRIDVVVGFEPGGLILGGALAGRLNAGFVAVRRPLKRGKVALEMHVDSIKPGARVLIVDDVLIAGAEPATAAELTRHQSGVVVGFAFVVELEGLGGRQKLLDDAGGKTDVCSLVPVPRR